MYTVLSQRTNTIISLSGGVADNSASVRNMKDVFLPSNATWIKGAASNIDAEKSIITLVDSTIMEYNYLVVTAGLETDWIALPGLVLEKAINDKESGVISIYDYNYADKTWKAIRDFKKGRAFLPSPPLL